MLGSIPFRRDAMATPETRLRELNIPLPEPAKPMAKYKPTVLVGNLLYVSGHGPVKQGDPKLQAGKVGANLNTEQGKQCARLVGINILATVKNALDRKSVV